MAGTSWKISGDYMETCNCDYFCPCLPSNMAAEPTKGHCDAAMVFRIDQGHFGDVNLDGLKFAVVMHSPGVMADGNITVGLITDERATPEQQEAILGIASGQAGGPMAALAPLVGNFAGVELAPIHYSQDGNSRAAEAPNLLKQAVEAIPGLDPDQALYIDNSLHPANSRLALAKSTESHYSAFGINYDSSGGNNGHFAPFSWQG